MRETCMTWDVFRGEDLPDEATLQELDIDVILSDVLLMRKTNHKVWGRAKPPVKTNKCLRNDWIIDG